MKGKDKKALHSKTVAELVSLLKEKREVLSKTKMELAINKRKNIHEPANLRRDIAIIETIKKKLEVSHV